MLRNVTNPFHTGTERYHQVWVIMASASCKEKKTTDVLFCTYSLIEKHWRHLKRIQVCSKNEIVRRIVCIFKGDQEEEKVQYGTES